MQAIRCSQCQKELEYLGDPGSMFGPGTSVRGSQAAFRAMEQWRGNVCVKCQMVFCPRCIEVGYPTPCPKCGEPTDPAQRSYLEQAHKI